MVKALFGNWYVYKLVGEFLKKWVATANFHTHNFPLVLLFTFKVPCVYINLS